MTIGIKVEIKRQSKEAKHQLSLQKCVATVNNNWNNFKKDKVRIMERVKDPALVKATIITKQHSGLITEMERLLIIWLGD